MPSDSDHIDTDRIRTGTPTPDLIALVREVLRGQRELDGDVRAIRDEVGAINIRLARGTDALESVSGLWADARAQSREMATLQTKVGILMWVAAVTGTAGIGGLVTAVLSLVLK